MLAKLLDVVCRSILPVFHLCRLAVAARFCRQTSAADCLYAFDVPVMFHNAGTFMISLLFGNLVGEETLTFIIGTFVDGRLLSTSFQDCTVPKKEKKRRAFNKKVWREFDKTGLYDSVHLPVL